jgi:hypothetical protein
MGWNIDSAAISKFPVMISSALLVYYITTSSKLLSSRQGLLVVLA